jgi:hypothetical protein
MTAAVGWPPPPARTRPWQSGPPGVFFYLATGVAILIAIDASSRDALWMFVVGAAAWVTIAVVWFIRFAVTASRARLRMPIVQWLRWMVIPVAMGLVFVVGLSGGMFDARLAASRGALDLMAADVMSGGPVERGWVGLYDVGQVERTANGFRFVVDDSGLYRVGFAYAPDGKPALTDDNYSPLWTGATFEPLGGGWWLWTEEWD